MTSSSPSDDLAGRYAALRAAGKTPRAYDAAEALGVSEVELVAAGCVGTPVRLRPDWPGLFESFPKLGTVMALTRNRHAVHEKTGRYEDVQVRNHGGLVLGPDIDLRLFLNRWHSAFAVDSERHRSLQFFDAQGRAVHKIFTRPETDLAAWSALVAEFAAPGLDTPVVKPPAEPHAPQPKRKQADAAGLRLAWAALTDTHDFVVMLSKLGLERQEAFRLAGAEFATPVAPQAFRRVLSDAAQSGQPIMIFVPNKATIQIHTGPVARLQPTGDWFNVLDPGFNLHLRETAITAAWMVRKPTSDGTVTSLELFDGDGAVIAYLFGARKPGQPEDPHWREIAETAARDLAA